MLSDSRAPIIEGAVMLDRVIGEIQQGLITGVPWLDVAFGRAQRLVKTSPGGRRYTLPNVYAGGWNGHAPNDYVEVSPDAEIGNFSFFAIDDPQTVMPGVGLKQIRSPFGLIVWFDCRRAFDRANYRNTEQLKADVLRVLTGRTGFALSSGHIEVTRIFEQAVNIYRGFSLDEVDNQFLMHPYGGFRIDGTLDFLEVCV